MLRIAVWLSILWNSDDGWFDRIARRHPVLAASLVGLILGSVGWSVDSVIARAFLPFDAMLGMSIGLALMIGSPLVWVRRHHLPNVEDPEPRSDDERWAEFGPEAR